MSQFRFKKPKPVGREPSVTLPAPRPGLKHFTKYLAAQFNRTQLFLSNEAFNAVIIAVDSAYEAVRHQNQNVTEGRGRFLIICHQALYSAASCLVRGTALDAAASSRRALEAARTALAIKLDARNAERWLAYNERLDRWKSRQAGEKPPKLRISAARDFHVAL